MSMHLITDNTKTGKVFIITVRFNNGTVAEYRGKDVGFPDVNPALFFVFKNENDDVPRHIINLTDIHDVEIV